MRERRVGTPKIGRFDILLSGVSRFERKLNSIGVRSPKSLSTFLDDRAFVDSADLRVCASGCFDHDEDPAGE